MRDRSRCRGSATETYSSAARAVRRLLRAGASHGLWSALALRKRDLSIDSLMKRNRLDPIAAKDRSLADMLAHDSYPTLTRMT